MKIPDFVLIESFNYYSPSGIDNYTLEKGTFVKPIELQYVPEHILEDKRWVNFKESTHIFCYTCYGIMPVERRIIGEK